jgi:hypothetical protein
METTTMEMKKVTYDGFFAVINQHDAIVDIVGNKYPYTHVFKKRYGGELGRIVHSFPDGKVWPEIKEYFLT